MKAVDHGKIYTVRSNARRDARKAGLDPDLVVAVDGGWRIGEPSRTKRARLLSWLRQPDGVSAAAALVALGWRPHTLRGAISTLAKAERLRIIREVRPVPDMPAGQVFYRAEAIDG